MRRSATASATMPRRDATRMPALLALPVLGLIAVSLVGQGTASAVGLTLLATAVIVVGIVAFAVILKNESTARKIGVWADSLYLVVHHFSRGLIVGSVMLRERDRRTQSGDKYCYHRVLRPASPSTVSTPVPCAPAVFAFPRFLRGFPRDDPG